MNDTPTLPSKLALTTGEFAKVVAAFRGSRPSRTAIMTWIAEDKLVANDVSVGDVPRYIVPVASVVDFVQDNFPSGALAGARAQVQPDLLDVFDYVVAMTQIATSEATDARVRSDANVAALAV